VINNFQNIAGVKLGQVRRQSGLASSRRERGGGEAADQINLRCVRPF
jgi:hypothetical protein